MKDILGKYIRTSNGKEFVYGRIGDLELYIYPKGELGKANEPNILKLLSALDVQEKNILERYQKSRNELLSYLSNTERQKYLSEGRIVRPQEKEIQKSVTSMQGSLLIVPLIHRIHALNLQTGKKKEYEKVLAELKEVLENSEPKRSS